MKNGELYSPNCPDDHAKKLVKAYVLRGLTDDRGTYFTDKLLARQYAVYEEWLAEMRKSITSFDCSFYEWLGRGGNGDPAFIFKPGDLVKHNGHHCVVVRRDTRNMGWTNRWRIRDGKPVQESGPQPVCVVELRGSDGRALTVHALDANLEPADIPPEVFALACSKASDCPMMRGAQ